jgi:serine O-acetyltransferase
MRLIDKIPVLPLSKLAKQIRQEQEIFDYSVPAVKESQRWVKDMVTLLFPIRESKRLSVEELQTSLNVMSRRLVKLLLPLKANLDQQPEIISTEFFEGLPEVYQALLKDAEAFTDCDPAAESLEEIIIAYPGFFTLMVYRMAHELLRLGVPVLPRVLTEYTHTKTGIDIHPGAVIGKNCFIDHGTGTVIGETSVVGDNVKIYQGVTLGALYVKKEMADTKRHPTIEDNVILYSGCTILGGETIIGKDSVIGGNVFLTHSVDPGSIVYNENKVKIREKETRSQTINFSI